MNFKVFLTAISFLSNSFFNIQVFAGGTVVGNGGDPVFEFMEAARFSMLESLKIIANDPNEQKSFCKQQSLSISQIEFCRSYFQDVLPQILKLNQGLNKTPFVLRDKPLFVVGPDGQPMVVAARTSSGPSGPIEFNRDAIKTMLPTQVLFLISHEFQHKISYDGSFIGDNEPIGPFSLGRDLLDSAAKYLVSVARRNGKIGSQFGIRDIFDCTAITGTSQFGARLSSSRLFQSEDLMSYETSIGKNPADGSIYFPERNDTSLILKFHITEPNNCGQPDPSRGYTAQIVRQVKLDDGSVQEEVLSEIKSDRNPMCPQSDSKIEISWEQINFTCEYFGSQGTTSSPFSLRHLRSSYKRAE